MPADTSLFAVTFAVAAFCLAVLPGLPREKDWARNLVGFLILVTAARYLAWRYTATLPSASATTGEAIWAWICIVAETAAFVELAAFLVVMGRWSDRRPEADGHQARLQTMPADQVPSVDLFLPTYNEGPEVVERSILGALAIDYPRLTVWVLDDGGRDWLRDFCERHGARYLRRAERQHAKAGNMNHALLRATGDLVAVLDADFVPQANFLWRIVGFFDDPKIGIVQTPQHFFNRDPIQNNLSLDRCWPDEQRLFFDVMAPGRDAWDAAFCCGSGSVVRRSALDEIGGFPTASITEDLLTTLALLRRGYITRYLNERLAQGLAAESLEAFFVQRQRWCRGALQSLFLPEGPLGPGLSLWQRFLFFPFSWIIQYPVRVLFLVVPAVYLWTGVTPLASTGTEEIFAYLLPALGMALMGLRWLAPTTYLPFLSTVGSVFASFRLLPTVVAGLIRPFGTGFRVTPKGSLTRLGTVDLTTFGLLSLVAAVTAGGLAINLVPEWRVLASDEFFPMAAAWGMTNLAILLIASLLCFERKRPRAEERFGGRDTGFLDPGGQEVPCEILDLSLGGARVKFSGSVPDKVNLALPGAATITAKVVRRDSETLGLQFAGDDKTRATLVRTIFGQGRSNAVERANPQDAFLGLLRAVFG